MNAVKNAKKDANEQLRIARRATLNALNARKTVEAATPGAKGGPMGSAAKLGSALESLLGAQVFAVK